MIDDRVPRDLLKIQESLLDLREMGIRQEVLVEQLVLQIKKLDARLDKHEDRIHRLEQNPDRKDGAGSKILITGYVALAASVTSGLLYILNHLLGAQQ